MRALIIISFIVTAYLVSKRLWFKKAVAKTQALAKDTVSDAKADFQAQTQQIVKEFKEASDPIMQEMPKQKLMPIPIASEDNQPIWSPQQEIFRQPLRGIPVDEIPVLKQGTPNPVVAAPTYPSYPKVSDPLMLMQDASPIRSQEVKIDTSPFLTRMLLPQSEI